MKCDECEGKELYFLNGRLEAFVMFYFSGGVYCQFEESIKVDISFELVAHNDEVGINLAGELDRNIKDFKS